MNKDLTQGLCIVREVVGHRPVRLAPNAESATPAPARPAPKPLTKSAPVGYVSRWTTAGENRARVADHVGRRFDAMLEIGIDPLVVRAARELAPQHAAADTVAEADRKLEAPMVEVHRAFLAKGNELAGEANRPEPNLSAFSG